MFIYLGNSHTATLKGRFPKQVHCGECETDYVYYLEREATGSGFSLLGFFGGSAAEAAEERAARNLAKTFENELDVVPCPECGFINEEMVAESRRLRLRWMKITAIVLMPLFVMCLPLYLSSRTSDADRGINRFFMVLLLLCLVGSVGLLVARQVLNQKHDPNDMKKAKRIKWGKSRAVTLEEFEAMEAEAEAEAEAKKKAKDRPATKRKRSVEE